MTLHMTYRSAM